MPDVRAEPPSQPGPVARLHHEDHLRPFQQLRRHHLLGVGRQARRGDLQVGAAGEDRLRRRAASAVAAADEQNAQRARPPGPRGAAQPLTLRDFKPGAVRGLLGAPVDTSAPPPTSPMCRNRKGSRDGRVTTRSSVPPIASM